MCSLSPSLALDSHLDFEEHRRQFRETPTSPECSQESPRADDSHPPEPKLLGRARLSLVERLSRLNTRSCLHCGTTGRYISTCPLKRPGSSVGTSTLVRRTGSFKSPIPLSKTPCYGVTRPNHSRCICIYYGSPLAAAKAYIQYQFHVYVGVYCACECANVCIASRSPLFHNVFFYLFFFYLILLLA